MKNKKTKKNLKSIHATPYGPAVENIKKILTILKLLYPRVPSTTLSHRTAFQLLIATILAAQSTDKLVNRITPDLFKKYKSPEDFVNADIAQLEQDIKPTGFYKNKSKAIMNCSKDIIDSFGGKVPDNIEDLTSLYGVGRKTANVVLANVYGKEAIIVDTHMKRISNRLGLTISPDPVKIEFDLMKIIPEKNWSSFSHQVITHGRGTCDAKKPQCQTCRLLKYCRYGQENT